MPLTHATALGPRQEQQDRYIISDLPEGQLLAVMDGHGGTRTAEILAAHTAALFQLGLAAHPADPLQALRDTVQRLAQRTAIEPSGSTLSVVFIPSQAKAAYVAIIGDSPVVIQDEQGALLIGPMHNARINIAERNAATQRGACYIDGYLEDVQLPGNGLQMARALGDRALARILKREPDTYSVALEKTSFILLATDGVLDGSNLDFEGQLIKLTRQIQEGLEAQGVIDDALRRNTGDNVTAIVWRP